jgi:Tol biopolymer transport system component
MKTQFILFFILLLFVFVLMIGCGSGGGGGGGDTSYTIVRVTTNEADYDPSYSPDGAWMVFARKISTEAYLLYKINLSTSQEVLLSGGSEPSWDPSNQNKIAYIGYSRDGIYTMNTSGVTQEHLTTPGASHPSWSRDGQYMAYASASRIMKINSNGTGTQELTTPSDGTCQWPAFSYDGTKILFIKARSGGESGSGDIWIMNADGTSKESFYTSTEAGADVYFLVFQYPWNQYNEIVFMVIYPTGSLKAPRVGLIKSDKSGFKFLTSAEVVSGDPVWDSTGSKVAIIQGPGRGSESQSIYYLIYR